MTNEQMVRVYARLPEDWKRLVFEREIARHDWHFIRSRNTDAWRAGERHLALLEELALLLPWEFVAETWTEHKPENFNAQPPADWMRRRPPTT